MESPIAALPEDTKFWDFEGIPVAEIEFGFFAFDPDKRPFSSMTVRESAEPCSRSAAEELWAHWAAGK